MAGHGVTTSLLSGLCLVVLNVVFLAWLWRRDVGVDVSGNVLCRLGG